MIYVLTGNNLYEVRLRQAEIAKDLNAQIKQPSLDNLTLLDLSVLLLGENLFSENTTIILNGLSERKDIFEPALNLIIKNKDKTNVILIENTLDKRTIVYKNLVKNAKIEDHKEYTDRDHVFLAKWLQNYIKEKNTTSSTQPSIKLIQALINWVGPNQEQLAHAADRLLVMNDFSEEGIKTYIPKTPSSFAFDLLATAINKDTKKLDKIMAELKQTQDPYMLFGLLTSQLIQVVALANASSVENVGKDLGASPYAVGNLKRVIKISPSKAKSALDIFYDADKANKSTGIDPWQATEIALKRLTQL